MIRDLLFPGLLDTGTISKKLMVIRDGVVNFYVLVSNTGLICVDTGWRASHVSKSFNSLGLNIHDVKTVLLTHLHWDHSGCLNLFPHAEIILNDQEVSPFFSKQRHFLRTITGEPEIIIDNLTIHVLKTPGHSRGSVSYLIDGTLLFTGDTLCLKQGKVFPFLSLFNNNNKILHQSIHKLADLKGVECLLTAHSGISWTLEDAFCAWRRLPGHTPQGSVRS